MTHYRYMGRSAHIVAVPEESRFPETERASHLDRVYDRGLRTAIAETRLD
jgi:hypothetical protein